MECPECGLIFVDPSQRLVPDEEKKRYDFHENSPDDPGYRTFLNQLFEPMNARLPAGSFGLDYGSGPGPTLHLMFEEAGHHMMIYDPFYAKDETVFEQTFDFITVTETAEHFYDPANEFKKLWSLLKPGGYLGIMTLLVPEKIPFKEWHYIKDDTHVSLYSTKTFQWLADGYEAELDILGERVIMLRKA